LYCEEKMAIDLNCDMGESFGVYRIGCDVEVMPWITSANISCGYHAGDPVVMDQTVRLAIKNGVNIGAHPGYPDLQGFGRRMMDLTVDEIENMVLYQIGALAAFARSMGADLVHVKPHGALYNQSARDRTVASAIARGTARFSKNVILVGLAGSVSIEMGLDAGLKVANEAFPDRAYNADGSLRSRRLPGAVLEAPEEVVKQALLLVQNGIVMHGEIERKIQVDTLCLHGDHPSAGDNARMVKEAMLAAGVGVSPLPLL
jgi:5-oxoprolinase (ATP-hydrolysing) subunit A